MRIYNFLQLNTDDGYRELMIKKIGRNLKNIRLRKGMTQEQVSEIAGINPKYYGEIERCEKNPTLFFAHKIAKALDIKICEMLLEGCPFLEKEIHKEIARLFDGKKEDELQKAKRILEVFFE